MEVTGKQVYERKERTGESWEQVGDYFGISRGAAKYRGTKYRKDHDLPIPDTVNIVGGLEDEPAPDPREVWGRALRVQKRQEEVRAFRANRRVEYSGDTTVLFFMGDLHLGGRGVDYASIDREIVFINDLAERGVNVGVILLGDLIDGFIIGRLQALRMTESPFLTIEEWSLVDYALERLAQHVVGSVAGNHDSWSWALSGIDLLRARHKALTPGILYDEFELGFVWQVGEFECKVLCRHRWKGNSKYNPTHGLEDHHWTRGREFDIGVMGHTHRGGLAREFDNGGDVGYAIVVGSYKKDDSYADRIGYPPPLPTSAVAVVADEHGIITATSKIDSLARLLEKETG